MHWVTRRAGWAGMPPCSCCPPSTQPPFAVPPPAELPALLDAALLGKYLKVSKEELEVGSLADALLMRMAARDC